MMMLGARVERFVVTHAYPFIASAGFTLLELARRR